MLAQKQPRIKRAVSYTHLEAGAASPNLYLGIGIAFGLAILAVFFVMWLLSKKRRWAMIVLLVLFSLDSAAVSYTHLALS